MVLYLRRSGAAGRRCWGAMLITIGCLLAARWRSQSSPSSIEVACRLTKQASRHAPPSRPNAAGKTAVMDGGGRKIPPDAYFAAWPCSRRAAGRALARPARRRSATRRPRLYPRAARRVPVPFAAMWIVAEKMIRLSQAALRSASPFVGAGDLPPRLRRSGNGSASPAVLPGFAFKMRIALVAVGDAGDVPQRAISPAQNSSSSPRLSRSAIRRS